MKRLCVERILEQKAYTYRLECGHVYHSENWKSIGSPWCGSPAQSVDCKECDSRSP